MDFAERMIARTEQRRKEFHEDLRALREEGMLGDEDFKAIISTRDEIVVKTNKPEDEDDKENKISSNKPHLSRAAHERHKKLAALYSENTAGPSSPVYKPHDRFSPNSRSEKYDSKELRPSTSRDRLAVERAKRFADLAKNINEWEDESDKKANLKVKDKAPKLKPVLKESIRATEKNFTKLPGNSLSNPSEQKANPSEQKKHGWDRKIIQSLEAQGYQRCDSKQHLIYDYKSPKNSPVKCSTTERNSTSPIKTVSPKEKEISPTKKRISPKGINTAVMELAAKYEDSPTTKVKDPTELSVMDRKALFEKNKGGVILPKAPLGMPVPAKALLKPVEILPSPSSVEKVPEKQNNQTPLTKTKLEWPKITSSPNSKPRDMVTESILERQREIEELRNRWDKKKAAISSLEKSPTKEEERHVHFVPKPPPMPPQLSSPSKRNWSHTLYPDENQESVHIPVPPPMPHRSFPPEPKFRYHHTDYMEEKSPILKQLPMSQQSSPKRIKMGTQSPVRRRDICEETLSPVERNGEDYIKRSPRKSDGYTSLSEIRPIRVSPPKPGRLYPSVSDIETESEIQESDFDNKESERDFSSETDESGESLGQEIVEASRISRTSLKRPSMYSEELSTSENVSEQESRIIHEMEDFLDEALGEASPPKKSRDSLEYEIERAMTSQVSGSIKSDSFEFSGESTSEDTSNKTVTLVHTVSMYRKLAPLVTPVKTVVTNEEKYEEKKSKDTVSEEILVRQRIKELECEMMKQTTIISQATQALNVCHSRIEFTGSPEEIEAEKLLLLATSRRAAAMREIERLKVEKKLKSGGIIEDTERGDLTIEQITLPIKPLSCGVEKVDNFVCLATSGANVLATQCLSAKRHDTKLTFLSPLKFECLYPDFTVSLEVYKLSTTLPSEMIPHDVKYGICHSAEKKKDRLRFTPQKKSAKSRIESPAGPNAVRSPSFQLMGFAVFSLREVNRTKFTLSKVPYGAPVEGTLEVKMATRLQTDLIYKGFLTIFEEIGGFGAWKRHWGVLSGTILSLWMYPEHEDEKIPLDTIDLSQCHNKEVGLVSREICARPHTFLVEIVGGMRYLMSADTIEDRVGWCKAINKSLCLLSAWGKQLRS